MSNVVEQAVRDAVNMELSVAIGNHGLNHSMHEKIALIAEEFDETKEEMSFADNLLMSAWHDTRNDLESDFCVHTQRMAEVCIRIAIEAIQTAAMCMKPIVAKNPDETKENT